MRALRARRSLKYALTTALTLLVVSTSGTVMSPARAAVPAADPKVTGTITVSAASSLADVFPVIAKAFQKRYPGTTVKFNFGGSSTLVNQIKSGAPVDVLATASEPTMWSAEPLTDSAAFGFVADSDLVRLARKPRLIHLNFI
jgi:molybdate transport system substrate-binding protein